MKKLTAILFHLSLLLFTFVLSAAIPQHWTVETSRVQPAQFEAFHGETIEFAATMQTYGKPLAITNDLIGIYWQTNGMGSAYWTYPAVLSNNVMIARWEPSMDVGANVYSCFIGAPGEIYRAAFQLRLRPSPGAVPSELPLPVKTLDFAQVTVLNAPYYSKSETDAKIIELAPTPGNFAIVSNRAMTAVSSEIAVGPSGNPTPILRPMKIGLGSRLYGDKLAVSWSGGKVLYGILSDFTGFSPFLTSFTESDPNVPSWAKEALKPSYTWNEIGSKPTFAAVATSGAYSDLTGKPSIPTDSTVAGWGYIKSYSESDPTVDGKISTHNSSSSAHADIRNTVNNLADNVSTWSSFWSGDDVRVTVTNYDSAVNLPSLYLEYKLSNGLFRTVWDERTRWNTNELRMAALESAVEGKADRAWGYYDSHTGGWAPDGYTWLSSPKIAISGGLAYQKHVTSEGAVWVLESNGLIAESGGVMSNGFFRISDDEGNPLFEIVKGDKRTVGATAGSCEPLAGYAITHLQIGYAVESADHPKIYVTRSLTPVDWKDEEDADCPATVNWSGSSGNWTAVVAGKVAEAQLFVKAEYEVGGNTYIKQSAPVSVQKLVLGGNEYRVGTATISGHTVLTLTLEP